MLGMGKICCVVKKEVGNEEILQQGSAGTGCRRRNLGFGIRNRISYVRGGHHSVELIEHGDDHNARFNYDSLDHSLDDDAVSAYEWCSDWVTVHGSDSAVGLLPADRPLERTGKIGLVVIAQLVDQFVLAPCMELVPAVTDFSLANSRKGRWSRHGSVNGWSATGCSAASQSSPCLCQ